MNKLINSMLAASMVVSMATSVFADDIDNVDVSDNVGSLSTKSSEVDGFNFETEPLLENKNIKTNSAYSTLMGKDRINTSVEVSKKTYPYGSETAVVVNGFVYADSISAIPVSAKRGGPILLTAGKELEGELASELNRLDVKNVILIGGSSSISDKIYKKLEEDKYRVSRISGSNRYLTNQEVIKEIYGKTYYNKVVFVSGDNFADSISGGVYAYKTKAPIVLVPSTLDQDNKKYLSDLNVNEPILIGGTRYLPKELDNMYTNSQRYAGFNRYDTSYTINTRLFDNPKNLVITTGEDFADALSGVPYAANNEANLVLYDNNPRTYINSDKYSSIICLGGRIASKFRNKSINKWIYSKDYVKSADMLLSNKLPREGSMDNPIDFKGSFSPLKSESRSSRRQLYGFFYLNDLVNAFEESGNRSYLEKGMELIRIFEKEQANTYDDMMWHDDTTARRLDYYLRFYSVANILLNPSDKDLLNKSMYNMATKMLSPGFWAGNYNHGLFQDMAVLRYADYIGDRGMYKLSLTRAAEYFNTHFDQEGVHIENSPEYHFVMLKELGDFLKQVSRADTNYYEILKNKFEMSKKYSRSIILPDGLLPVVGDTGMIKPNLEDYYGPEKEEEGDQIKRFTFKNAGYDIARSKDAFLMMRGGYLTDVHHHNDDLSFWLYKKGNIFTEVGAFGYEYSNPLSKYVRTFKAHNSLVVDSDNNYGGLGREVKILDGDSSTMVGISKRPKNTDFTRKIKYNPDMTEISIKDKVQARDNSSHKYELYFHLDPEIEVSLKDKTAIIKRGNIEIGKMTSTAPMKLDKDIFCKNYREDIKNTSVIVLEVSGKDQLVDTKIELK